MRALRASAAAICCILGPASIGPSDAQPNASFGLQVCNLSGVKSVSVAVLSKYDIGGTTWRVSGWYAIPDSGCANLGALWRDRFYIFGQGANGAYWNGSDTNQCVNLTSKFERIISANYPSCAPGETTVGMSLVTIPASDPGPFSLNLY